MLAHVAHSDTEVACALVNNQGARLERSDSSLIEVVEVFECHKVTQEAIEIAMEQQ